MQIEKQIMTYDLFSYSQELQQAVLDGYRIVDQTIGFPQQIGSTLCASLVKATEKPLQSLETPSDESTLSQHVRMQRRVLRQLKKRCKWLLLMTP